VAPSQGEAGASASLDGNGTVHRERQYEAIFSSLGFQPLEVSNLAWVLEVDRLDQAG
jgi:hypothetical protein